MTKVTVFTSKPFISPFIILKQVIVLTPCVTNNGPDLLSLTLLTVRNLSQTDSRLQPHPKGTRYRPQTVYKDEKTRLSDLEEKWREPIPESGFYGMTGVRQERSLDSESSKVTEFGR